MRSTNPPELGAGGNKGMTPIIMSQFPAAIHDANGNSQLPQTMALGPRSAERKKRTRTGCLNCCRRRRKCDEVKPGCTGCKRRGEDCQWRQLGSFREANIKVLESDHPSMNQTRSTSKNNKRQSKFKILNALPGPQNTRKPITKRSEGDPELPGQQILFLAPSAQALEHEATPSIRSSTGDNSQAPQDSDHAILSANTAPIQSLTPPLSGNGPLHVAQSPGQISMNHDDNKNHCSPNRCEALHRTQFPTNTQASFGSPNTQTDVSTHAYLDSSPSHVENLTTLQHLAQPHQFQSSITSPYQSHNSPLFDEGVFSDPTDPINDIFLPGSAYEALHTTLRNRQLWTARPDVPRRRDSHDSRSQNNTNPSYSDSGSLSRVPLSQASRKGRLFELTPEREHLLWQNYLREICSWLDMFDNNRHFASTFPQMAKTAPHLRYAILALSARQLERRDNEKSQSESLLLYQEAIHLLLPELEHKTIPAIASCVILCVLEMLSCNPKEWRRHLDGCAYLIQAAGINGFSGKEEQALFWCFARMDVCGGLISEEETIIPIHNWRPPDMSCNEASERFLSSAENNLDTYSNHTVYMCAETLGVLFGTSEVLHPCTSCPSVMKDGNSYVHRWQEVFKNSELWYANRPSQMKPVFTVAVATPGYYGKNRPFPTVVYGNTNAISGNQLYHVCALLLLQQKPKTLVLSKKPKSVLWHARQICAISASNTHHGCWTNALQPLWIAGKVMSHYSEHAAIIETLVRIEREIGWATAWRVEDLKEFWGDYDNDDEYDIDML